MSLAVWLQINVSVVVVGLEIICSVVAEGSSSIERAVNQMTYAELFENSLM
jgi:hypothetical protein